MHSPHRRDEYGEGVGLATVIHHSRLLWDLARRPKTYSLSSLSVSCHPSPALPFRPGAVYSPAGNLSHDRAVTLAVGAGEGGAPIGKALCLVIGRVIVTIAAVIRYIQLSILLGEGPFIIETVIQRVSLEALPTGPASCRPRGGRRRRHRIRSAAGGRSRHCYCQKLS